MGKVEAEDHISKYIKISRSLGLSDDDMLEHINLACKTSNVIDDTNKFLFGGHNVKESPSKLMQENRIYEGFNSLGWTQVVYQFENGIEVSVVRYGYCWELMIVKNRNGIYIDFISDIFRGDDEQINEMLNDIKDLG